MNLGKTIKKLRMNKNLTQKKLGDILGVGVSTISNYETGYSTPDIETLMTMAEIFGVSLEELMGKEEKFVDDSLSVDIIKPKQGEKIVSINVYGRIAAGVPNEAIENITGTEQIIINNYETSDDYFALDVNGNSMSPKVQSGDVVICKKQEDVNNNEIAAILINGHDATLKRIKKSESGITLIPENPSYDPVFYSNMEIEELPVKILGKVVELRRKF